MSIQRESVQSVSSVVDVRIRPMFDTAKLRRLELFLAGKEREAKIGVHTVVDPVNTISD